MKSRRPIEWLIIGVAVAGAAILAIYAVNALLAVAVWLALFAVAVLAAWIILGRLWDTLRHGKPLFRQHSLPRPGRGSSSDGSGDGAGGGGGDGGGDGAAPPRGGALDDDVIVTDRNTLQDALERAKKK